MTVGENIRRRIRESGPISFFDFMESCLYGEGGYYRRARPAIGEDGDYVTGSTLSPLFARSTARLVSKLSRAFGGAVDYLEAGYGTGAHLAEVSSSVDAAEARRFLAWDRVERSAPAGALPVRDLKDLEAGSVKGVIFSYELFDALSVHRLVGRADGTLGELFVALDESGGFFWEERDLEHGGLADRLRGVSLEAGQIADVAPQAGELYRNLASRLGRGLLVTCDYGFDRRRLFDVRVRRHGTLACYSRQRVHRNPFVLPGEQDLTAHVDFTTLVEAGEAAGLETVCLTRQALWLVATGVFEDLADADLATREQAMGLLDGDGMGSDIRVLAQARGLQVQDVLETDMLGASRAF